MTSPVVPPTRCTKAAKSSRYALYSVLRMTWQRQDEESGLSERRAKAYGRRRRRHAGRKRAADLSPIRYPQPRPSWELTSPRPPPLPPPLPPLHPRPRAFHRSEDPQLPPPPPTSMFISSRSSLVRLSEK